MAEKSSILVVDDDPDIRELVGQILSDNNYDLVTAADGEEALEIIKNRRFDLIIMDLMMPGISGMEVCQQIKQDPDLSEIPIIMLTAKAGISDRIDGFMIGADEYITKPFDPIKLETRVHTILRRINRDKEGAK